MRIAAFTLHGPPDTPMMSHPVSAGLSAFHGPPGSGKSLTAGLLAHTLFGKAPVRCGETRSVTPPGEVIIECEAGRLRVRRYCDAGGAARLTVAALDGSTVNSTTMRSIVGGLSPAALAPLCAVSFREPPDIARLLSAEFAREFRSLVGGGVFELSRRTAGLAARRDVLAQELESRIAGERRLSSELEAQSRKLEQQIRDEQRQYASLEQRFHAVDAALAETDARLRYRRLELNVAVRWSASEPVDSMVSLTALDEQIARTRTLLAEFAQQEAEVRARLAKIEASLADRGSTAAEEQAWLAVARQLAGDLAGEVARLARAGAAQQCVCRDAHPRLRPIAETFERQMSILETLFEQRRQSDAAAELQLELVRVSSVHEELRKHLEHLLNRRHALAQNMAMPQGARPGGASFSAADAQQLEARRQELEQERFGLVEQLRSRKQKLRDLRGQREAIERQRAALLSARSIDHVQRELAAVQQKLEQAVLVAAPEQGAVLCDEPLRASDFLAQLTGGELVRLVLTDDGRRAQAVNRDGQTLSVESLAPAERDLVYLSLCLALLSAASRQGVWLPLVLDEPFERLDAKPAAALAGVLAQASRDGHQVLVFTSQRAAIEHLAAAGALTRDIMASSKPAGPPLAPALSTKRRSGRAPVAPKRNGKRRRIDVDRTDAA